MLALRRQQVGKANFWLSFGNQLPEGIRETDHTKGAGYMSKLDGAVAGLDFSICGQAHSHD